MGGGKLLKQMYDFYRTESAGSSHDRSLQGAFSRR